MVANRHTQYRYRLLEGANRPTSIGQTFHEFAPAPFAVHYPHSMDGLRALAQLTDEERQVIDCGYFEGLSQTQTSERMAKPSGP